MSEEKNRKPTALLILCKYYYDTAEVVNEMLKNMKINYH